MLTYKIIREHKFIYNYEKLELCRKLVEQALLIDTHILYCVVFFFELKDMAESTVSYNILQLVPRSYFILVGKALEQCITRYLSV